VHEKKSKKMVRLKLALRKIRYSVYILVTYNF
jgi:hypothetical protein